MPQTIRTPWRDAEAEFDPEDVVRIALRAERSTLEKRKWNGVAEDGRTFYFDLPESLPDGAVFHCDDQGLYFLEQLPEPVLEITLSEVESAASIAWALGTIRAPMEITDERICVPDSSEVRRVLQQLDVAYEQNLRVLHPLAFPGK